MVYREVGAGERLKLNNSVGSPGGGGSLGNGVVLDGHLDVETLEFISIGCRFQIFTYDMNDDILRSL